MGTLVRLCGGISERRARRRRHSNRAWLECLILLNVLSAHFSAGAWEPVRLTAYPQKFRTFFSLQETNGPRWAFAPASPLAIGAITTTVRSTDGALWLGTTQGVLRVDLTGPDRDRFQYFAGRCYFPDSSVEHRI